MVGEYRPTKPPVTRKHPTHIGLAYVEPDMPAGGLPCLRIRCPVVIRKPLFFPVDQGL